MKKGRPMVLKRVNTINPLNIPKITIRLMEIFLENSIKVYVILTKMNSARVSDKILYP